MTQSLGPRHLGVVLKSISRGALALGALLIGAAASADPLNLDFGPLGPSYHDVGAIDAGVNIVRLGNVTASGIPVGAAVLFSVPDGIQVDRMTLTYLSNSASLGAFLVPKLLAPNAGSVMQVAPIGTEVDFSGLAINDPSSVSASFLVTLHPDYGGTVDAYFALRIYASTITSAVPEPAAATLWAAGLAGLLLMRRRQARLP